MKFCPDCETYLMTEIVNNENTNKILTYKCKNCNTSDVVIIINSQLTYSKCKKYLHNL